METKAELRKQKQDLEKKCWELCREIDAVKRLNELFKSQIKYQDDDYELWKTANEKYLSLFFQEYLKNHLEIEFEYGEPYSDKEGEIVGIKTKVY
jgi:hypothetical protein